MDKVRYVYWRDGEFWVGYVEEYPDYMTQGLTLEELQENLLDLLQDFSSGAVPCIRRVGELQVA